ncbi:MAG: hypothetical protein ACRD15_22125, partial [Vicinamibacterales bacterium]
SACWAPLTPTQSPTSLIVILGAPVIAITMLTVAAERRGVRVLLAAHHVHLHHGRLFQSRMDCGDTPLTHASWFCAAQNPALPN